jgi:trimethylamine--corrinoid protein Co-methyltransferase
MYDRLQELNKKQMSAIHDSSMDILKHTGIGFKDEDARALFQKHGFKIDGNTVFFEEKQVMKALETAPRQFAVRARDQDKNVSIGGDDYVLAPGYGAPFVTDRKGEQREATLADYETFCKLVQTSPFINMNGFMMVEPSDVPAGTAHLDMILSNILFCDKPFMGSPVNRQAVADCMDMATMVWGDRAKEEPVTVSLINSLSPLAFSEEMSGSLIELARHGQACIVAALIMAGSSGPITVAGVLAQQNAEILAGLTLGQLVRPGVPIIYGSTSAPTDMRTGALSIGAAEVSIFISCAAQMARFYNLPSRSGGGLTDSHIPDMQAGVQSSFGLLTAVRSGINFILHAAGIVGGYIGMSFEKFMIDEELCGMVRCLFKPVEVSDETLQTELIKQVGAGGEFLSLDETLARCRSEYFFPEIMKAVDHNGWKLSGGMPADERAAQLMEKRLSSYERPDIDSELEKDLRNFVKKRKG